MKVAGEATSPEETPSSLQGGHRSLRYFQARMGERILGTDLQQIWRDHLLVLAMLQHPDRSWSEGIYVLVYPKGNPSFPRAAERYRDVLKDDSTFEVRSIEQLLDAHVLHTDALERAFRERYLWAE
jgi:hypothetical protein